MGVLAGTWAVIGLTTLTAPPGATSRGLAVLLVGSGLALFVPAAAAAPAKIAPAAVMGLAGLRLDGRCRLEVGRRGPGRTAVEDGGPLGPDRLATEAGVRPQL